MTTSRSYGTRAPLGASRSELAPDEVVGIRARFVLAESERAAWGEVFRLRRGGCGGVVRAIVAADRVVMAMRRSK